MCQAKSKRAGACDPSYFPLSAMAKVADAIALALYALFTAWALTVAELSRMNGK